METALKTKNFDLCSHIEQDLSFEKMSTMINSKNSENESVMIRQKKIHKKTKKNKKNKKRGFFSLPQKANKNDLFVEEKFLSYKNFSDSQNLAKLPNMTKTKKNQNLKKINKNKKKSKIQKIHFLSKRQNRSFSFFSFEEDKLKIGEFKNCLHLKVSEDNDVETDEEIFVNALLHNFESLKKNVNF